MEAVQWLQKKNIKVRRVLAGTYMTSLNMPGFSLTLLLLPNGNEGPYTSKEILGLLDATASAPGWKYYSAQEPGKLDAKAVEVSAQKPKEVDLPRKHPYHYKPLTILMISGRLSGIHRCRHSSLSLAHRGRARAHQARSNRRRWRCWSYTRSGSQGYLEGYQGGQAKWQECH